MAARKKTPKVDEVVDETVFTESTVEETVVTEPTVEEVTITEPPAEDPAEPETAAKASAPPPPAEEQKPAAPVVGYKELVWVKLTGSSSAVMNGRMMVQGETRQVMFAIFKQHNDVRPSTWQVKLPGSGEYQYI